MPHPPLQSSPSRPRTVRSTDEQLSLPPLSGASSPLSAVSRTGSWSGSSCSQGQLTPRTPDSDFPLVAAAIATPGIGAEDDETIVNALQALKESQTYAKLPRCVDPHVNSVPVDPIVIACEARSLDPNLPISASPERIRTRLPAATQRGRPQQLPQKHVSWSSASMSDSLNLDTPPIVPMDPLSEDEIKKVQSFLRELQEFDDLENRFALQETPPALYRDKKPRLSPSKQRQDGARVESSLEKRHSTLVDHAELVDPARCSLLIQEVSLMVGLPLDDDAPNLSACSLPVPNGMGHSEHAPSGDIPLRLQSPLPLSISPAESLPLRRRDNPPLTSSGQSGPRMCPSEILTPFYNSPHVEEKNTGIQSDYRFLETNPSFRSRGSVISITRHKSADAIHSSVHFRRRHGQVFQFDPSTVNTSSAPPPKPLSDLPSSRLSSLDRLEFSLEKLKAHAPVNHHKSQSEGMRPSYLGQKEKLAVLRKQQSSYDISQRKTSRPVRGRHFSTPIPPVSELPPAPPCVVEPPLPAPPSEDERLSTPGSFMDMDIPSPEETLQTKRISFRYATNNAKMKNLVQTAKRVSRKVITWGKNLAGPPKPAINGTKATPIRRSYI